MDVKWLISIFRQSCIDFIYSQQTWVEYTKNVKLLEKKWFENIHIYNMQGDVPKHHRYCIYIIFNFRNILFVQIFLLFVKQRIFMEVVKIFFKYYYL